MRHMRIEPICILLIMMGFGFGNQVAAEMLTNPGFENDLNGFLIEGSMDTTSTNVPPPTSTAIPGNAITESFLAGDGDPVLTDVLPTEGDFFAVLSTDGVTATKISQTFDLTNNADILSFDFRLLTDEIGTGPEGNDGFMAILETDDGFRVERVMNREMLQPGGSGPLSDSAIAGVGGLLAGTPWLTHEFEVSSIQGQTVTLSFVVYDVFDAFVVTELVLDNIRVQAVPEPRTSSLLGLGLLSIGLGRQLIRSRTKAIRGV